MPLRLRRNTRGASIIEFALLLPVFACMLYGMLGYGQYFLLAHSVQQMANDAARATVAGLTTAERRTLANDTITREAAALPEIRPGALTSTVSEDATTVTVRLRLDASGTPLFANRLAPMPDPGIDRRALVGLGGVL